MLIRRSTWSTVMLAFGIAAVVASPAWAARAPARAHDNGTLKIATSYQWPPFDYADSSGRPKGLDIDIMTAIAKKLDLKPVFTNLTFDSIVPSVSNGRFDVGVNEFADTVSRRKAVQFVDYYNSGIGLLVKKGQKSTISPTNLCGHTLALTQGSSQIELAQGVSKKCVSQGKKAIKFLMFPDSAPTILAVANGRAEGFLTDAAVGVYLSKTSDPTLTVPPGAVPGSFALSGILVAKSNTKLAKQIQGALQSLMESGAYKQILSKYGVADEGIKKATINGK